MSALWRLVELGGGKHSGEERQEGAVKEARGSPPAQPLSGEVTKLEVSLGWCLEVPAYSGSGW